MGKNNEQVTYQTLQAEWQAESERLMATYKKTYWLPKLKNLQYNCNHIARYVITSSSPEGYKSYYVCGTCNANFGHH